MCAVERHAFSSRCAHRSVLLSDGVVFMSDYLYDECSSLAEAFIPESTSGILDQCFMRCNKLSFTELVSGNLYFETDQMVLFHKKRKLCHSKHCEAIAESAFYDYDNHHRQR